MAFWLSAAGGMIAIVVGAATQAAEAWPDSTAVLPQGWRGTGGSLGIGPAICWWLVVLGWVCTVDWVHRDATKRGITPAF
jgi:hypothetical protein